MTDGSLLAGFLAPTLNWIRTTSATHPATLRLQPKPLPAGGTCVEQFHVLCRVPHNQNIKTCHSERSNENRGNEDGASLAQGCQEVLEDTTNTP